MKYTIDGKDMHIYFEHERCVDEAGKIISNRGGKTIAYIIDKKTGMITKGESVCSHKDIYNKKLGRTIALGRLFKQIGINPKVALNL